jgi:hypothetical protein
VLSSVSQARDAATIVLSDLIGGRIAASAASSLADIRQMFTLAHLCLAHQSISERDVGADLEPDPAMIRGLSLMELLMIRVL